MKLMFNILMIMVCLFGYISVALGTIFVLKIGMMEIFGIDVVEWYEQHRRH